MPASVMTMPEATKAAQMYQQGYGLPQIARELGRSRKAVRTAFRQLGLSLRARQEAYHAWLQLRGGKGPHDGSSRRRARGALASGLPTVSPLRHEARPDEPDTASGLQVARQDDTQAKEQTNE